MNSQEEAELENPKATIQSLKNRIEDLEHNSEMWAQENSELRTKNAELSRELNSLRREAEKGFEYYPGPSSHCAMCEADLTNPLGKNESKAKVERRVAHGLCDTCRPQYDQLHPGSRLSPQAEVGPDLRPV